MIRNARPEDAEAICGIYNHYVLKSTITFEEEPVSVAVMRERILEVTRNLPWIVDMEEGTITGYAYAYPWKIRSAYRHTVESGIYLHGEFTGKGIGTRLYGELLRLLKEEAFHAVIGGIALPNPASIALHEKLGFVNIGRFREVGFKFGKWIDVGYWELVFKEAGDAM
jgi:L-amino acid N-acyltransferase YncA